MSTEVRTGVVAVEGSEIYYERRGSGSALLLISGGGGDAGYYSALADLLAEEYTVLTYDIRGNSRSRLTADLAALRAGGVPMILAGGHDSRTMFYCRTGEVLAERLGIEFVEFPGAHSAYFEDAPPFAATLRETLAHLRERASS